MRCRSSIPALAALAICLTFVSPAGAQSRRGGMTRSRPMSPPGQGKVNPGARTPIEEFETMSPEQRQKALERLPPEQRQRLQQRLDRFNQLPPEQQRSLKNLYNRLHQLPPDRQDAVRKSINKLSQQPPERQQAMRQELRSMASMSPDERQAHVSSPEFRGKFNKKEQEIVRDITEVLPRQ
jgi:hypothetical protein